MNKKFRSFIALIALFISLCACLVKPAIAEETAQVVSTNISEVNVYMFRGEGCGYCAKALEWFEEIEESDGKYFNLITYEVWNDESNKALMDRVAKYMGEEVSGVPYIIVGKETFSGFDDTYKEKILNSINLEYAKNVEERFDVIKDINENKDKPKADFASFIIVVVFILIVGFVLVARKVSDETEVINYEEIISKEEEKTSKKKTSSSKKKTEKSSKKTK